MFLAIGMCVAIFISGLSVIVTFILPIPEYAMLFTRDNIVPSWIAVPAYTFAFTACGATWFAIFILLVNLFKYYILKQTDIQDYV